MCLTRAQAIEAAATRLALEQLVDSLLSLNEAEMAARLACEDALRSRTAETVLLRSAGMEKDLAIQGLEQAMDHQAADYQKRLFNRGITWGGIGVGVGAIVTLVLLNTASP